MNFNYRILLLLIFSINACSSKAKQVVGEDVTTRDAKPQSFEKIAPITASALEGRKNLNENGWKFIPSTRKSLEEASRDGRISALTAKAMIFVSLKKRAEDYPGNLGNRMKGISEYGKSYENSVTRLSKEIMKGTLDIVKLESDTAKNLFEQSGDKFVQGYANLIPISKEDTKEIFTKMSEFNGEMGKNYKRLDEMFGDTTKKSGQRISTAWRSAYSKAVQEFEDEYKESGERPNSILAVWDIFQGYTYALKELALSPLGETAKGSGQFMANGTVLTGGYVANAGGQGIISTGMVIYTPVKFGYRIISPSLVSGFLSTMGLSSAIATAPTIVSGSTVAAFNQVTAVSAVGAVRGSAAVGNTIYETGTTAAGMVYDIGKGTSKSVLYGLKSGVVLGYAALTVIPANIVLAVPDGTLFLAWDGPRLVIARVRGNYKGFDSLPTGSIVDLEEAKKAGKVEIISEDEKLIKKVLEKEIEEREEMMKAKENSEEKK